jgi:hypothetical protein
MPICVVRIENVCYLGGSLLNIIAWNLLPFCCYRPWSCIKLRYIQNWKLMSFHKFTCFFVIFFSLVWKTTNYVSCNCHILNIRSKKITNFIKLFDSILSIHFVKNWIRTRLNWNMQKPINSRMV